MKKTIILLSLILVCVAALILLKSSGRIVFQDDLIAILDDRNEDPCWFLASKGFDSVPEVAVKSRQDRVGVFRGHTDRKSAPDFQ